MSATAINNLVSRPDKPALAIHHLSQSFRLMNRRLSSNTVVSDATMAVVVAMAQFERHQGDYQRGLVHLDGLMRMVEMRGGISRLTQYRPPLTQKIFRYAEKFVCGTILIC